jgi:mannose-6-phosphate isomerase-like protein (cupin superfamily)
MEYTAINFREKLATFSEHWSPKVVAQMNDYQFKLVKIQGEFVWHSHADTDDVFIVLDGEMSIELGDGRVDLKAGEMFVVPGRSSTNRLPRANASSCSLSRWGRLTRVTLVVR